MTNAYELDKSKSVNGSPELFFELPPHVSEAVTKTVELFAQKANRKHPDSPQITATSWYHDEPIWFVESEEPTAAGTLVRRVQIGAFKPNSPIESARLHFLPDAYRYNPKAIQQGMLERLIEAAVVVSHGRTVEILNSRGNPYSSRTLLPKIRAALTASWEFISRAEVIN